MTAIRTETLRALFVTLSALLCAGTAQAQAAPDIVQILGQFVTAETAAKMCGVPGPSDDGFRRNREIVTLRATEALMQRNPALPPEDVRAREAKAIEKQVDDMAAVVRRVGCSDPGVVGLVKLYGIQSTVDLGR